VKLYKRCGAQYFFALANHHDNFDLWDSKYHHWNSIQLGPHKNIIAGWAAAARHNKLPFGVSVHSSHAWMFYEPAQLADTAGQYKGIPYDGKLTKADGKGTWWEGLDPQELYAQNHAKTPHQNTAKQWRWGGGAVVPDQAYCEDFYNRTMDLINKYHPDLVYFDDTALPLWPVSDAGLYIASNFYNQNMKLHGGKLQGVIFGKILTEQQQKCLVWDVERGALDKINPRTWQTCSCIGTWHYNINVYNHHSYKSSKTVIQMLSDIVSKNGNLLLSIPVSRDGTIDEKEEAILQGIAGWMDENKECIFGTRPWTVFGEGPDAEQSHELKAEGFNEGQSKYTSSDIRFTKKGKAIYAILMERPADGKVCIKSFAATSTLLPRPIKQVTVLGHGVVKYSRNAQGLSLTLPADKHFMPVVKLVTK
jgi:alpha-L-fucosidase